MSDTNYLCIPVFWITGASTGIGRATALELVKRGKTVVASARRKDKLQTLVQEAVMQSSRGAQNGTTGGRIIALPLDVTDSKAVAEAVQKIESDYGYIEGVMLNAGGWDKTHVGVLNLEDFTKTYDLNVFGVVRVLEHIIPLMKQRKRGHISMTASVAGFGGLPDAYGYTSSKAALINLAESLAIDLEPQGIKVQLINPGFVRTPLTEVNKFPMPFLMEPQEAAIRIADGLASDRFEITFPWKLTLPMKFVRLFPYSIWIGTLKLLMRVRAMKANS